jgi:hypothetical protein
LSPSGSTTFVTLKTIDIPIGLDVAEAERLLADVSAKTDLGARIDHLSEHLLNSGYIEGSLGGGPNSPEEFRVSMSAFDCVTFIETVLALAAARTSGEFIETIRRIRYEGGEISWNRRNHYMVDWARNNVNLGFIQNLTTGPQASEKTCTLSLIPGLPEKVTTFSYFPTQNSAVVAQLFETGDVLVFVSTKETLDVFHTGFLIERAGRWVLRHATRAAGSVIDQELLEFINQNTMAGFVLLRPLCQQ